MIETQYRHTVTPRRIYEYYINGVLVFEGTMDQLVEWSGVARTTLTNQIAERKDKDGVYRHTVPTNKKVYIPRLKKVKVDTTVYDFYLGNDLLMTGTIDLLAYEWNTAIPTLANKIKKEFQEPKNENVIQIVPRKG